MIYSQGQDPWVYVKLSEIRPQGRQPDKHVFMCCDPCQEQRCEKPDCDHGELDQKEFARAEDALELGHHGCFCFVTPKEE